MKRFKFPHCPPMPGGSITTIYCAASRMIKMNTMPTTDKFRPVFILLMLVINSLLLYACVPTTSTPFAAPTMAITTENSPTPPLPTTSQTSTKSQVETPTPEKTPEPARADCPKPSDNYEVLEINGHQLNMRTFEMLQTAQDLYDGPIDITGDAITQGSYTNAVEASFGTHAGGGAVDLSVMAPGTFSILYEDIEPLIQALRQAGFAAWYRDFNELYEGSPVHIHAIAVGDRELSQAAREQLAGPFGYFWGYNGLPTADGNPIRDPHGGPIMCEWMVKKGYPNKTATPSQ